MGVVYFVVGLVLSSIINIGGGQLLGGGTGTINQLQQFVSTTSPSSAITQAVYGKALRLTGLESLGCLGTNADGIVGGGTCSGGAASAHDIATTSSIAVPDLAYFTKTGGLTTLGSVPTSTLSATSPLALTGTTVIVGTARTLSLDTTGAWLGNAGTVTNGVYTTDAGSVFEVPLTFGDGLTRTANDVDCDTASGSVFGCLSSADWTTFNAKASAAYEIATTSDIALSQVAYISRVSGRTTLASVATGTISVPTGLTITANRYALGGSAAIALDTGYVIPLQSTLDAKALGATTITVAGTANQITSSAGAQDLSANRTWTLSLPSQVIVPGQASSTQFSSYQAYFGGTATTTFFTNGSVGVSSSTPFGFFSINPIAGIPSATAPKFVIGSSTATSLIVTNDGRLGIGTSSPGVGQGNLIVEAGSMTTGMTLTGSNASFLEMNIQNRSASAGASSDYVVTADNGTASTNYADFGINGSGGGATPFSTAGQAYLYNIGSSLNIGALGSASDIVFANTGGTSPVETARFTFRNNLGIGTTTPQWRLTVASSTGPQITITDTSLTTTPYNLRTINGNFYLSTSTALTFATSTLPAISVIGSTGNVGIATATPWGRFSVEPIGVAGPEFVVGSSTKTDFIVDNAGQVGIGTTTPKKIFHVYGAQTGGIMRVERRAAGVAASIFGTQDIAFSNTGADTVGTGPAQTFSYIDSAGTVNALADISGVTAGGNTSGALSLRTYLAGTPNIGLVINQVSDVGIGTTSNVFPTALTISTSTTGQLTLTDGSLTQSQHNFRSINGLLYISTSSALTFATTTPALMALDAATGSTTVVKLDVTGVATSSHGGGINLTSGCFSISNACIGSGAGTPGGSGTEVQYRSGASTFGAIANSTYVTQALGNGWLGFGTSTPKWTMTLSSSTNPQLTLTDGSLTSPPFNFRDINNALYISTSSPTTFATTSSSLFMLDAATASTTLIKLDVSGTATSTFGGNLRLIGMNASRVMFTDGNSNIVGSGASAALLNALSDETGTGVAVFGTSPTFTTDLRTPIAMGGTAVTSGIILQGTSGASPTTASVTIRAAATISPTMTFTTRGIGMGTTTPNWLLNLASSTAPQLVLSSGRSALDPDYAFRVASSTLYLSTTSPGVAGMPTTTIPLLSVDKNGFFGFGTSTPFGKYSIDSGINLGTSPLLTIGSSTITALLMDGWGKIGIGTTTPWSRVTLGNGFLGVASSSITVAQYNPATSTSQTVDCRDSNTIFVSLGTGATTITLASMIGGQSCVVHVQNPNASAGAITWATTNSQKLWWASGGAVPTQTTTANKSDMWSFKAVHSPTNSTTTPQTIIYGAQTPNFGP